MPDVRLIAQQQKSPDSSLPAPTSDALRHKAWYQYGGDPDQSKYVDLKQITKDNVTQLQVAWTYPASNGTASMFNPIVVDDMMYLLGSNNSAHRARRRHRQRNLDPRQPQRHHQTRHQLLGEQGPQRPPPHLLHEQHPPGDRRHAPASRS